MAAVDDTVMPGDEVVLIGKQGEEEIKVDERAELAGTIPVSYTHLDVYKRQVFI